MKILSLEEAVEISKQIRDDRLDKYASYALFALKNVYEDIKRYVRDMNRSKHTDAVTIYFQNADAYEEIRKEIFSTLQIICNREELKQLSLSSSDSKNIFIVFDRLKNYYFGKDETFYQIFNELAYVKISVEDKINFENRVVENCIEN